MYLPGRDGECFELFADSSVRYPESLKRPLFT